MKKITQNQAAINFFIQHLKPYKIQLFFIILVPFVSSAFTFLINYSIKLIIDTLSSHDYLTMSLILKPALIYVIANLFFDLVCVVGHVAEYFMWPTLFRDLLCGVYRDVSYLRLSFFYKNASGSILSRIKGINEDFVHMFHIFIGLIFAFFNIAITSIYLLFIHIKMSFIVLIFYVLYLPYFIKIYSKLARMRKIASNMYHYAIGLVGDKIRNIFNIILSSKRKREVDELKVYYNNKQIRIHRKYFKLKAISDAINGVMFSSFFIGSLACLVYLRNTNQITNGTIALAMSMILLFSNNFTSLIQEYKKFLESFARFKSSYSILTDTSNVEENENHLPDINIDKASINIKNLSFQYNDGVSVFDNFNLNIKAGEKVAIVGRSGNGKSTLITLLLKIIKPQSGQIEIDGQDIEMYNSKSLRSKIALIQQETELFSRSVRDNIEYGSRKNTLDKIKNVAHSARIGSYIETLKKQYDTKIYENGKNLSGGQKQRINIARALIKDNTKILILDEATSALDGTTESEVQSYIHQQSTEKNMTVITIAHRINTIKHMDRIIVLQKGQIAEEGTFDELMKIANGQLKSMWLKQNKGVFEK